MDSFPASLWLEAGIDYPFVAGGGFRHKQSAQPGLVGSKETAVSKLASQWAGHLYGTNTGNLFLQLQESEGDKRQARLRVMDQRDGLTIYEGEAVFDGSHIRLGAVPKEGEGAPRLVAAGKLTSSGSLAGNWEATTGAAGTFVLFLMTLSKMRMLSARRRRRFTRLPAT